MAVSELLKSIKEAYDEAKPLLLGESYSTSHDMKLKTDSKSIEIIKTLLDSLKDLERFIKPFLGSGKEESKDDVFYGEFTPCYESISLIDRLYDKVRNYVTQKPYSSSKIRVNFSCSSFLNGWAQKFDTKGGVIFRSEGNYYLCIVERYASILWLTAYRRIQT